MYTRLAATGTDPQQQMRFIRLADVEGTHKARLADISLNTAFPEAW